MVLDMQVKASEYPGLTLQIKDAGEDNDTQIKQIREFIKQRVDLVIISANESEPVTTAAVEAFRAGIPTIIIRYGRFIRKNIRLLSVRTIMRLAVQPDCLSIHC